MIRCGMLVRVAVAPLLAHVASLSLSLLAALEARVAAAYATVQKPKRQMLKGVPFLKQNSLIRRKRRIRFHRELNGHRSISTFRTFRGQILHRSNSPLNAQPKLDEALVLYSRGDRSLFTKCSSD